MTMNKSLGLFGSQFYPVILSRSYFGEKGDQENLQSLEMVDIKTLKPVP